MPTTLTWHSDPSHAWLEVTEDQIEALGIGEKISPYSYKDGGGKAFLEEDCDAALFLFKLGKAMGCNPRDLIASEHVHSETDSIIREFRRWEGTLWNPRSSRTARMEAFLDREYLNAP